MKTLQSIPVVGWIIDKTPHMDFEGQKLAETIYRSVIILFSVVGLIWGYICQQFDHTIYVMGAGVTLSLILVLIPWPFYRRNPLNWQKLDTPPTTTTTSKPKGKRKQKQKD
jgi:signal peptidase complex subunit 1